VAIAGCAASGAGSPSGCASDLARHDASLGEVLDSSGVRADLEAFWAPEIGRTVANLQYDSAGALDTAWVASATLREEARARVEAMLLARARPRGEPEQRVGLFLGDEDGAAPRRVRGLRGCAPRWLRPDLVGQRLAAEARALGVARLVTAYVMVHVREDGRVGEVRIERTSGDPAVDAAAVRVLRDALFLPGMVEGIPMAVWAAFPLTFTPGR